MTVEKQARQPRNYWVSTARQYSRFSSILASDIEREAYGEDLGQQNGERLANNGKIIQARQRAAANPIA